MMKNVILSACFLLIGSIAYAQNILEVRDVSRPDDVYPNANEEAAVVIRCDQSIQLAFTSSIDKSAKPFRSELEGTDSLYYIAFPTGNNYRGRLLTIYPRGYYTVDIPLRLKPQQLLTFHIGEPELLPVDTVCYQIHHDIGVDEIRNGNYSEARDQFVIARECNDCNKEENEQHISLVDSIVFYRKKGEEAFKQLDYVAAGDYYSKVLALNAYDTYAKNQRSLCAQKFSEECASLFSSAEYFYRAKDYQNAKALYEKVIAKGCSNMDIAVERLNATNYMIEVKKTHPHVFTYEYSKDTPIGLSYGTYNYHKVGGFFQFDLNPSVFDVVRSDRKYRDEKFPEMNVSLGMTVKIVSPIWIHFGPGFTAKKYYGEFQEKRRADYKAAISPVMGITAKYGYVALRFTYQYRWSLKKDMKDFIGRDRISAGIGIAF